MPDTAILIRRETPADYRAVEELTRSAFWNHHVPGCCEHYLMHLLRADESFVPELSLVAEQGGKIVGAIAYTNARISGDDGCSHDVLSFGPISVLPALQRTGVGRLLIERSAALAAALGHCAVLIYGDPDYYCRFGFVPASEYGIATHDDCYAAALLALELVPGALGHCTGRFFEAAVYDVDEAAAEEFDRTFPPLEKKSGLPTQARFLTLVTLRTPRGCAAPNQ